MGKLSHVYSYATKNGIKYYTKYKNITKRGFETKTEAYNEYCKLRLNDGEQKDVNVYFQDVANDYLEQLLRETKFSTYSKCEAAFRNHVFKNVKNKKICKITKKDCIEFYNYVKSLNCSTASKNYYLDKFKAIFKHAIKDYGLQQDPAKDLKFFKQTFNELEKARNFQIWTNEEFNRFINCEQKEVYRLFFTVLFYTGLRKGEAQALTWKDFADERLSITKTLTNKTSKKGIGYEITLPKNNSSIRKVRCDEYLCQLLNNYKKKEMQKVNFSENWFIFGEIRPLSSTSINRRKNNAAKAAGLHIIKIHDLRHSHASILFAKNVDAMAISKRLGHKDVLITLTTYTHLLKDSDKKMLDTITKMSEETCNSLMNNIE